MSNTRFFAERGCHETDTVEDAVFEILLSEEAGDDRQNGTLGRPRMSFVALTLLVSAGAFLAAGGWELL